MTHSLLGMHTPPDTGGSPPATHVSSGATTWGPLRHAATAGSSIWARDAVPWIGDFLNAAYFRRDEHERDVADLRLAFAILTTSWYRSDPARRLALRDLARFHRAFGAARLAGDGAHRGCLDREQLLRGGARLLGDWFPAAYGDEARRGWGIAFPRAADRARYAPRLRRALARVGDLTPPRAPADEQTWWLGEPVAVASAQTARAALLAPETWPDFAGGAARFTPLRAGALAGQTFEVEAAAGSRGAWPVFVRGYVTVTSVVTADDARAMRAWFDSFELDMARYGPGDDDVLPYAAQPLIGIELTTHAGHFAGAGRDRLMLFEHLGRLHARVAGTRDPMPLDRAAVLRRGAREPQDLVWGDGSRSGTGILHELARAPED